MQALDQKVDGLKLLHARPIGRTRRQEGLADGALQPIAQAILAPVIHAAWTEVENLDETERGAGGFGSTGR